MTLIFNGFLEVVKTAKCHQAQCSGS